MVENNVHTKIRKNLSKTMTTVIKNCTVMQTVMQTFHHHWWNAFKCRKYEWTRKYIKVKQINKIFYFVTYVLIYFPSILFLFIIYILNSSTPAFDYKFLFYTVNYRSTIVKLYFILSIFSVCKFKEEKKMTWFTIKNTTCN